jgi:hypothetical protein
MQNAAVIEREPGTSLPPAESLRLTIDWPEIARLNREIKTEREAEARKRKADAQALIEARKREEARAARSTVSHD